MWFPLPLKPRAQIVAPLPVKELELVQLMNAPPWSEKGAAVSETELTLPAVITGPTLELTVSELGPELMLPEQVVVL